MTDNNLRLSKVPYPQLILIQEKNEHIPVVHYPELATYFKTQDLSYIYVRSAPVYALLVIAATSPEKTRIILSHSYSQKRVAKMLFVFNNIKPKLLLETEDQTQDNLHKSDLVVVSDNDWTPFPL